MSPTCGAAPCRIGFLKPKSKPDSSAAGRQATSPSCGAAQCCAARVTPAAAPSPAGTAEWQGARGWGGQQRALR